MDFWAVGLGIISRNLVNFLIGIYVRIIHKCWNGNKYAYLTITGPKDGKWWDVWALPKKLR